MPGPGFEQGSRQAARSRTDFDYAARVERSGGAGDAPRHIEVEDEILPEAAARPNAVLRDDLAQRRQRDQIGGHLPWCRAAISAASRNAAIRLSGRATPCPAISKAVP